MKTLVSALCFCLLLLGSDRSIRAQNNSAGSSVSLAESSTREQDGLRGPVRRVRIETAKIEVKDGKPTEGARVLRGSSTYDPQGRRIDSAAYPVEASNLSGKEQYKYDGKGNIVEMTLRGDDGSVLSKESYEYEFDELGNWKKMTSSIAVYQEGKLSFEPIEVTYRHISYYYNQAISKLKSAASKPTESSPSSSGTNVSGATKSPSPGSDAASMTAESQTSVRSVAVSTPTDSKVKDEGLKVSDTVSSTENRSSGEPGPAVKAPEVNTTSPGASPKNPPIKQVAEDGLKNAAIDPPKPRDVSPVAPSTSQSEKKTSELGEPQPESRPKERIAPSETKPTAEPSYSETAKSLYQKGVASLGSRRYGEAVQALKESIQLDPNDAIAYAKLGLAYSGLGQYKEAIPVFKMAVHIRPEAIDAEVYYQLGQAYRSLGKHSDALSAFKQGMYVKRAESTDPDTNSKRTSPTSPTFLDFHYRLAAEYYALKRFREAIDEFNQAIVLDPKLEEAYYALGMAYIAVGDRKSAEKQKEMLISLKSVLADKLNVALLSTRIDENALRRARIVR
jgi:YD repeat-containing protein